jgi:hypothetical protein
MRNGEGNFLVCHSSSYLMVQSETLTDRWTQELIGS